jgi:SAM-dependent methyltransferase
MRMSHGSDLKPSDWVLRWARLMPAQARVLDLACGQGRHFRWLAAQGHRVTGVDRDAVALQGLQSLGETLCADLENAPWPLGQRQFDAVVVTNYLWRALWPDLLASLAPGGVLIYETFAVGNETVGKPSRPDFLLQTGELLRVCADWRVVAYEDGFLSSPDRFVQRIAAVAPGAPASGPARYPL